MCESSFKDQEDLKEHWIEGTDLFCKTCKICCMGVSTKGTNEVFPDDPEHEGQDSNVIKNKCHECVFKTFKTTRLTSIVNNLCHCVAYLGS